MPIVGEIATFAFDNTKPSTTERLHHQGWIACEGQSVARVAGPSGLPHLFDVIGTSWGSDDPNAFNVPDLRGEFLRGWSHGKPGADPDAHDRLPADHHQRGAHGDKVGSLQPHAFAAHNHGILGGTPLGMVHDGVDICATHPDSQPRGRSNMMQGGQETRPRNVYVMYCIFTGHAPLPPKVKFFAS